MPEDITQASARHGLAGDDDGGTQTKAGEIAGQAQNTAQQAAGQAQAKLRDQLNERSSQAAAKITEQAADMRSVSETLRDQGKPGPAKAADRLAGYAESVGGYLRDKDSDQLLADMEDFGRRQPWAIAAGGLTLGFIASRFLKASSSRRYQTRTAGAQTEQMNRPLSPSAGNGVGAETPSAPPTPGAISGGTQAAPAGPGAVPAAGPGAVPPAGPGAVPPAGPGAVPAAGPGAVPPAGPGAVPAV